MSNLSCSLERHGYKNSRHLPGRQSGARLHVLCRSAINSWWPDGHADAPENHRSGPGAESTESTHPGGHQFAFVLAIVHEINACPKTQQRPETDSDENLLAEMMPTLNEPDVALSQRTSPSSIDDRQRRGRQFVDLGANTIPGEVGYED